MKKGFMYLLAAGAVVALATACDNDDKINNNGNDDNALIEKVEPLNAAGELNVPQEYTALNQSNGQFAWAMLGNIVEKNECRNIVVSPLSLSTDVAMLCNGACGETQNEILNALGMKGVRMSGVNCYYNVLSQGMPLLDPTVKFTSNNAIWYKETMKLEPAFTQTTQTMYLADIKACDMRSQYVVDDINHWVNDKTNGMIQKFINDASELPSLMGLFNAIYVKAPWTEPFDKERTEQGQFASPNGEVTVDYMKALRNVRYYQDNFVTAAFLPMGEKEMFDVFFVLPAKHIDMNDAVDYVGGKWKSIANDAKFYQVNMMIPKFSLNFKTSLTDCMKLMGCELMFDRKQADFGNISSDEDMFVEDILQVARFVIDEEGAEGCAVTGINVGITGNIMPIKPLQLTHPFIFGMRERKTGTMLFLGVVSQPGEE